MFLSGGSERSEAERGCSYLSAFTCFDSLPVSLHAFSGGGERSEAERGRSYLSAFTCFDSVGNVLACSLQVRASEAKRSEAVRTSVLLLVLILCQLSCILFQVGASEAKWSEAVLTSVLLFAFIELASFLHAFQFFIT